MIGIDFHDENFAQLLQEHVWLAVWRRLIVSDSTGGTGAGDTLQVLFFLFFPFSVFYSFFFYFFLLLGQSQDISALILLASFVTK